MNINRIKILIALFSAILIVTVGLILCYGTANAEPPPFGRGFGGRPGGGGGFGSMNMKEDLVKKYDSDGDGKLNDEERKKAREYIQSQSRDRREQNRPQTETSKEKNIVEMEKTFSYDTKADLYDEKVLRTLYLQFPNDDWFDELADFYRTDVEVPADLTVDGNKYPSVGVRFRGNTSYMMASEKKSFNISVDYNDDNQRLYGYKTLNLLNCNTDPTLIREVLYSKICREYLPAPKANFVKLVVNGENWGVYANIQQFNKDFLQDWFDTKDGVRWKIPANFSGTGALVWNGADPAKYKNIYELKTTDAPNAWNDLVNLCNVLNNTPVDQLESKLKPIFDIDGALWFIAMDNIFMDSDGYISRGSDYNLYEDPQGRFHMIPYDNNETFSNGEGPGPRREDSESSQNSLINDKDKMRPVISKLLAIPHLRARYLAHVKTITNEWLDWKKLEPIINEYQALIGEEVKADDKKQYTYDAFINSATQNNDTDDTEGEFGPPDGFGPPPDGFGPPDGFDGGFAPPPGMFADRDDDFGFGRGGPGGPQASVSLKSFVEKRHEFILNYPDINKSVPVIESVSLAIDNTKSITANESVQVNAKIAGEKVDSVILYYAKGINTPFESVNMTYDSNLGIYIGNIPPCPAGTLVRYYVEANSVASLGTTAFESAKAEFGAFTYHVATPIAKNSPVVINEIMVYKTTAQDEQIEEENWIELFNASDKDIDLTGMYMSDNSNKPRKWVFPENTVIAHKGYLVILAGKKKNSKDKTELHANFNLSKSNGELMLIDKDSQENAILDLIKFNEQQQGIALGRFPDGNGDFRQLTMTPGKKNKI